MMKTGFRIMAALLLAAALWTAAIADSARVSTGGGKLNMRKNPEDKAKILTTIKNGESVEVTETEGIWAKISYKGQTGYVKREFLKEISGALGKEIYSNGDTLYLRESPDPESPIVGLANAQAELKLENCQAKVIQRSDADFKDFYYMYCMVNGEKGWYSYDSAKDTFQRMVKFETIQKETEPETTTPPAHQEGKGWAALSKTTKMLLALLALAILIIIALLIALIVTNRKRKPKDTPPEGDAPKTPAEKLFAEEEAAAAAAETPAAGDPAEEPPAAEPPEENPAADHADILEELSLDDATEAPVETPAEAPAPDLMDMEKTIEELTLEIEDEIKGN